MQKARAKISVLLLIITVVAACILRFFQIYSDTGITGSYAVYLIIFSGFVFAGVYANSKRNLAKTFDIENGQRSVFLSSMILAVTFFYDFIHQGYNCYDYVSRVSYVDYTYIVPLGISGVFALLSCFYFLTFSLTMKNSNYDFRNFTLLHFSPVIWAIIKLFGIMLQIVDVKVNSEICCEFILLCVIICFLLSMISAVDRGDAPTTAFFVFSSVILAFMSCVVGVVRVALIIAEKGNNMNSVSFSAVTYIMLGIFSIHLLSDIYKRSK